MKVVTIDDYDKFGFRHQPSNSHIIFHNFFFDSESYDVLKSDEKVEGMHVFFYAHVC